MSGVVGQKLGRKKSATGGATSSRRYASISCFVVRHVKYVYDCENPLLASTYFSFGRVNASDRNIVSGWRAVTSRRHHSQNGIGLVCGLSTRNTRTPCSAQNRNTSRSPSHSPRQSALSKSNG